VEVLRGFRAGLGAGADWTVEVESSDALKSAFSCPFSGIFIDFQNFVDS